MPKTISANEARDWISDVSEQDDEVIVEIDGEPKAVILSIAEFKKIEELRDRQRRAEAIERLQALGEEMSKHRKPKEPLDQQTREDAVRDLRALQEEVSARNRDLTEEQIEEIANRFSHDIIDDIVAEGKITFERDLRVRE